MARILLVGHSHSHAVAMGTSGRDDLTFFSGFHWQEGKYTEKPFEMMLEAPTGHDGVVLMIRGSLHFSWGLFEHMQPFDFVLPENPGLPLNPRSRLLPAGMIRRIFSATMAPEVGLVKQLAVHLAGSRLFVIEAPPPVPADHLEETMSRYPEQTAGHIITPFPLRYKLWRVLSEIQRSGAEQAGATFVPAPPEAQLPDGSMAHQYCRDGMHGNGDYGALIIGQIDRLMEAG